MKAHIVVLPGDGIGPEVTGEAVRVLAAVSTVFGHEFTFQEHLFGGASIDAHGVPLTEQTLAACKAKGIRIKCAYGGHNHHQNYFGYPDDEVAHGE